ncbi:ABC transporter substrate-binding protein [Mesorhizobium sp. DCY119]|uniref:ABC transporter substrate-binding protein n=1 Tax=Mesorhizobium sp. DCY119 TaxID=2108445 RepID=UPI000E714B5A|nr:ABC transporter substrate-binding protein [Mesorhizobium sp. DCY119]RJG41277.1 ABC transporter substrate-binding protein [Mesorhizobium sp. DCY119]
MRSRLLSALLGAAMLAGGAAYAQAPEKGGTLNIVLGADIRSLDASKTDNNTDSVLYHIYDPLVAFKNDLTAGPALADSWEVSADGKTYTFKLKQGVTYHNGDKVVASDFKWLWERRMASKDGSDSPWLCIPTFDGSRGLKVVSVAAPDDGTLVMTLDAPSTLFLVRLADPVCNIWIASPKNVGADGKWIAGSAIGSGPFQLKEWKNEQYISLARFDGYVPGKGKRDGQSGDRTALVDEARFMIIPDKTAAETALFAGQVDVVSTIQPSRMEDLKANGATILSSPGLSLTAMLIQTNDPLLSNVKMRQAIAHALDFKQIATAQTAGMSEFNPSGVPQSSAYFEQSFVDSWPAYDLEKTRQLLAEAGYKGEPIKLQTNKRYIGMYDNAVVIQAMLTAAGINVELEVLDWAAQLDNFFAGKFQMQSFGYSSRPDPMVIYGMFTGDKTKTPNYQFGDPKALELYLKAVNTADFDARKALLKDLQNLMAEEVPMLGLYYFPVIEAVSTKITGYESWPLDRPRAWGVSKTQ